MRPVSGQEAALHEIVTALRESGGAVSSSLDVGAVDEPPESDSAAQVPYCALCHLAQRSAERSLRAFFTEFVNDPQVRVRFRKARGFCREHTPLLSQCGDALGVAILFADLADETRERWRSGIWSQKGRLFSHWFPAHEGLTCPCCVAEEDAETRFASAIADGLRHDASVWEALRVSSGLCVPHVERVGAAAAPGDAARLFAMEIKKLDALHAELEEFVRKNDYRYRGESWGAERDAWRRAVLRLRKP